MCERVPKGCGAGDEQINRINKTPFSEAVREYLSGDY